MDISSKVQVIKNFGGAKLRHWLNRLTGEAQMKIKSVSVKVALMTGSGPTIFALADKADVENIVDAVKDLPAQIFVTSIK